MVNRFSELADLETVVDSVSARARVKVLDRIQHGNLIFPIYSITLGSTDPQAPCLAMFGGVHGLERIGSKIVTSYLQTVTELIKWDEATQKLLEKTRLVFMPLVNPAGMYLGTRSNANGVDLMRNSPVNGEKVSKLFLPGGHRVSNKLPWYRGPANAEMEAEARALCKLVQTEIQSSKVSLSLDVHSGYGTVDRVWFPYAKSKAPFPNLAEIFALKRLLDRTYPNHVYRIEPQSKEYTTHGDLWDHLYDEHLQNSPDRMFIPLTIELGSWIWVKKNPRQIFSLLGAFNPIHAHRRQRALRRHLTLFDFMHRAVLSSGTWASLAESERTKLQEEALAYWY